MNSADGDELDRWIAEIQASVRRFVIMVVGVSVAVALLLCLPAPQLIGVIVHTVELAQAVLVCATALMGLSGLMIIETKRAANAITLGSDNGREEFRAMSRIVSLAKSYEFLRWTLVLSIFTIVSGVLRFVLDNPVLTAVLLSAFAAQVYVFIWGLLTSEFLPSQ